MELEEIEQQWLNHIPDFPFYMSVGDVSQFLVENEIDFLQHVYNNFGKDIYVALHSNEEREAETYRVVYIDIDNEDDLYSAYRTMMIIVRTLWASEYEFRLYFSGCKGFAIYIDFKPTHITKFRQKLEVFIDMIMDVLVSNNIDRGVCIDVTRISRLPYTINTKSDKLCHPLPTDISLEQLNISSLGIIHKLIETKRIALNEEFGRLLQELEIPIVYVSCIIPNTDYLSEYTHLMENADKLPAGVRHHAVRLKIIPTLVLIGYDDTFILAQCKLYYMNVFGKYTARDQSWVIAQIKLVRRKKLRPIRLINLANRYGNGSLGI